MRLGSFPPDHDAPDLREMRLRAARVEVLLQTCTARHHRRNEPSARELIGQLAKMREILEGWLYRERPNVHK